MENQSHRINVDRLPTNEETFTENFGIKIRENDDSNLEKIQKKLKKACDCSTFSFLSFFTGMFPIISWVKNYEKRWIVGDIVSGITVGVVHIPQSLAFSLLAGLPPVFGLYTSFYPVIVYTLMGTSRHLSIGTFAVTSLMTQDAINKIAPLPKVDANSTLLAVNSSVISSLGIRGVSEIDVERVQIASALTFLIGIFMLVFGVFGLGKITNYLSTPLVQAFTTGAGFHVITSQTPSTLGLKLSLNSGIGSFYKNWVLILRNLPNAHSPTVVVSVICILVLTVGREVNFRYKEKLKMPIPTEVIVVIIAILASYFGKFEEQYNMAIVKFIPTGFPAPAVPKMGLLSDIAADAFAIAIVAFAINISVAKLFATQKGYEIESNQELVAYGVGNFLSSFFLCFPSAAALARCAIQMSAGGNTQLVGVISVVIVLIVIMVLGPVFEPLPRAVLGCIIIVGLFGIVMQLKNLKRFYKFSKLELSVWVVTFLAVITLGVDYGLLAGIIYAILTVIVRSQLPRCEVLVNVNESEIYRAKGTCTKSSENPSIFIFKFYAGLYYANKDIFKAKLYAALKENEMLYLSDDKTHSKTDEEPRRKFVIVDCSAISFMDFGGSVALKEVFNDVKKNGYELLLASSNDDMKRVLRKEECQKLFGGKNLFISLHDAVVYAKNCL